MLHRYLDLISFHRKDTAFIIAVSGGAGAAEDFAAVGLEAGRQRIHLLLTADAERDVRVSGAGGRLRLVGHPGFVHQLQACAVRESEKVGAVPHDIATTAIRVSLDEANTMAEAEQFMVIFNHLYDKFSKIN